MAVFEVSGAGISAANGIYYPAGVNEDGVPSYTNGTYFLYAYTGTAAWNIASVNGENPGSGTINYYSTAAGSTPALGLYTVGASAPSGSAPAPTVSFPVPTWDFDILDGDTQILHGNPDTSGVEVLYYKLYSSATSGGSTTELYEADTPDFNLPAPATTTYYKFSAGHVGGIEGNLSTALAVNPAQETEMGRATVFQRRTLAAASILGTLPGTPVVFTLPSVICEVKPMQQNKTFMGRGYKGALGKTRG